MVDLLFHVPVQSDTNQREDTRVVGGRLVTQDWYCTITQLHRKGLAQECADLIKHLLEGGDTNKWKKISTRQQTAQRFQGLNGGEVKEFLTIENGFSNIEKLDILV